MASPPSDSSTQPSTSSLTPIKPATVVVTAPPWAKDEPPSPKDDGSIHEFTTDSRLSDVASYQSSHPGSPSRWWTFTTSPRPRDQFLEPGTPIRTERKNLTFKDRSISWLPTTTGPNALTRKFDRVRSGSGSNEPKSPSHDWNLSIQLPTPTEQPFTLAHTATPGWDTPWTSRAAAQGPNHHRRRSGSYGMSDVAEEGDTSSSHATKSLSPHQQRIKLLRRFILSNPYVPLLFRFINIALTAAALGIAVRIRQLEHKHSVVGVMGSSPTLVVIFAPLTMVHVMAAIYLEYFGRPLGLWRTSAKLAHTLSEVLFICAWSAALSLCFDNFFTSLVPCAHESRIAWYSKIARPTSNLPRFEGSVGDEICDEQLTLVCLVGIGLLMYCTNLVISLYRIFEKVKYHQAALSRS